VPKFHCPRCRDHWYGYSSVPCDEELARLIKEGLWYTGNKDKMPQGTYKQGMFVPGDYKASDAGEKASTKGLTQKGKLPRLKSSYKKSGSSGTQESQWNREGSDKSKRKKKITFKLEDSASDGSSTDLIADGSVSSVGSRGKNGSSLGKEGRGSGGLGGGSRAGNVVGRLGDGVNEEDRGLGGGRLGKGGVLNNGKDEHFNGKTGKFGAPLNSGRDHQLSSSNNSSGAADKTSLSLGLASHNNKNFDGPGNISFSQGNSKNLYGERDLSGHSGEEEFGLSGDLKTSAHSHDQSGRSDRLSTTTDNSSLTSQPGGDGRRHRDNKIKNVENEEGTKSGGSGVITSSAKSSNEGGGALVDHGKRVRKPGGYMKAVSPTSSEWGDHLHARSFISSSIHSRSGSISSMSGVKGRGGGMGDSLLGREKEKDSLPPIIPRIIGTDDYLSAWRPKITRAWTFSYFSVPAD